MSQRFLLGEVSLCEALCILCKNFLHFWVKDCCVELQNISKNIFKDFGGKDRRKETTKKT
jgi:hypothetical protein